MKIHYFLLGGELPTVQTVKFKAICNFTKTAEESASRRLKVSVLYLNKQTKAFLDLQQMLLANMHAYVCVRIGMFVSTGLHTHNCLFTHLGVCLCFDWISIFFDRIFSDEPSTQCLKASVMV